MRKLWLLTVLLAGVAGGAEAQTVTGNLRAENFLKEFSALNAGVSARANLGAVWNQNAIINNPFTYSNYNAACGASVIVNAPTHLCGVSGGFENGAPNISAYPTLDSVGEYVRNISPAAQLTLTNPTYDATHIFPATALSPTQIASVLNGMLVQTGMPILASATLTNAFTVVALSYTMTIAWPSHGLSVNNTVTFGTSTAVGSFSTIAGTYVVASVPDANTITVTLGSPSLTTASGVGGSVTAVANGYPWKGRALSATSSSIVMQDWSQFGNPAPGQVPANGLTAYVSATSKTYAVNWNSILATTPTSVAADGLELDLTNDASYSKPANFPLPIGMQIVQLGTAQGADGEIIRGDFQRGITVRGAVDAGFIFDPTSQSFPAPNLAGYLSLQPSGFAFAILPSNQTAFTFSVDSATGNITDAGTIHSFGAGIDIGQGLSAGGSAFLDFHFGGDTADFNFRVINSISNWLQLSAKNGVVASFNGAAGTIANSFTFSGAVTGNPVTIKPAGDATAGITILGATTGAVTLGSAGTTGSPVVTAGARVDGATAFILTAAVTNGATQTMAANTDGMVLENAALVASQTVKLPPITGVTGQTVKVSSDTGITALTLQTSAAGTITNSPTAIAPGGSINMISDGTIWHPAQ